MILDNVWFGIVLFGLFNFCIIIWCVVKHMDMWFWQTLEIYCWNGYVSLFIFICWRLQLYLFMTKSESTSTHQKVRYTHDARTLPGESRKYMYPITGSIYLACVYIYPVTGRIYLAWVYIYPITGNIYLACVYIYPITGSIYSAWAYIYPITGKIYLACVYIYLIT